MLAGLKTKRLQRNAILSSSPTRNAAHTPIRQCAVTRQHAEKSALLRFALSPDAIVVHDAKHRLPGRGVYCVSARDTVQAAIKKGVFNRAFRQQVTIPAELLERIEQQLREQMISVLHFARKAGMLIHGADRIKQQSAPNPPLMLHAAEASGGSKKPLQNTLQPRHLVESIPENVLEMLQPETRVRHLVVTDSQMAQQFMHAYQRWAGFTGNGAL